MTYYLIVAALVGIVIAEYFVTRHFRKLFWREQLQHGLTQNQLLQYKAALQGNEAENKARFKTVLDLQSKLRTSEFTNIRLEERAKKLEKWQIILENGEKPLTIEE